MIDAEAHRATPAEVLIRAARPTDCEAFAELVNLPGFRFGTLRLPFHSPEEVRRWIEMRAGSTVAIVALCGSDLVGAADLRRFEGRRAHVGEIGIGVHDAYAGRGIGTRLLASLIDTADRWLGLRRVQLTVFTDNQRAIALYRKFRFEIEGTHLAYALRDGALVDAHSMARLIDPPVRA